VKLPAHRAGLPGNEISFLFVPLDPAYKAGPAGHLPVKDMPYFPSHYVLFQGLPPILFSFFPVYVNVDL
jgi:hypothetical protein